MKYILSVCFYLMFIFAGSASLMAVQAFELSLGAGAYIEKSPYKEVGWLITPMPIVQFDSDYVFFEIDTAGVYLLNCDNWALMLLGDYMAMSYDSANADSAAMKEIDDRDSTIMTGARYAMWGAYGVVRADYMVDIIGDSDGQRARLSYGLYFPVAKLDILPTIGITWHSGKFNDYYFGVSPQEALASGIPVYAGEDSFTPYFALALQYNFTDHFKMLISSTYSRLPDEVTDSPITKNNYGLSILGALLYAF